MKKKICFLILITFMFIVLSSSVSAMSASDIKSRDVCNTLAFEVAYAEYDGSLSNVGCYGSYNDAKNVMNTTTGDNSDNLVILERNNSTTEIIDAKYALIDYDQYVYDTIYLYKNVGDTSAFTYIKGGSSDDAAFLGLVDSGSKKIKITISGFTGYMNKYDEKGNNQYDIVPLNWVKSALNYKVSSSGITINIVSNVFGNSTTKVVSYTYGSKPSMLNDGTYYSYDGKYFYNDLKTMLGDYMNSNYNNSVNKDHPYYNYYLYVSHRTKSTYSSTDINDYIKNVMGYNSKIVNGNVTATSSMLYNEGYSFYSAQELYGVNEMMAFGVARNESGNGRSVLSYTNNNIFGHNAVDSDPYGSASSYQSIQFAVFSHAYKWLSFGFLQPGDYSGRFNGGNLGNKATGVNVKYASDAYWGIKAAANYYQFDKSNGFQDYNYYKIAVKNNSVATVYPKKSASSSGLNISSSYYKLVLEDTPIVIVGEVIGTTVNGNNKWYKIMSDPMLDGQLEYTGSSTSFPRVTYNWDTNYVYVPAAYFNVINEGVIINTPSNVTKYEAVINPDYASTPDTGTGDSTPGKDDTSSLPSTDNPAASLEYRDNHLYYFENMSYTSNKLNVSGFLAITGMNNSTSSTSHRMIFKNVDSGVEYVYSVNHWTSSVPFEMTNSDEAVKYDYTGGWFSGNIDISNLPQGEYRMYIEISNGSYKTRSDFNNLFFKDMVNKTTSSNGKGFKFQMNYYEKSVPMELSVRDSGLITNSVAPTADTMFNSFETLEFSANKLHILGTSHNVNVNYSSGTNVSRTIVLENTSNYNRYTYNVGSITTGPYRVSLRADDGKDKTRAWFDAYLDLSSVSSGVYAIYIKTQGDGGEDYGELNDILYTNVNQTSTINGHKVYLRRADDKRFRIELVVE